MATGGAGGYARWPELFWRATAPRESANRDHWVRAVSRARLRRRWEGAALKGEPVDVQHDLMRYTVDVISSLAFGIDLNTLEE